MKALIAALALTITGFTAKAQILTDEFNSSVIDSSKWFTINRADGAAVSESGGSGILHNRGTLVSLQNFTSYDITGRFRFTGSGPDRFIAWTRTQGTSTNPYSDLDDGIVFRFQQDVSKVGIDVWNYFGNSNIILAEAPVSIPSNTWFDYRVTDDGTNVALYFNDLITPLITGTTSFAIGNKIAFNNSWNNATVEMDYIHVVPEPSAFLLIAMGLLGISCSRKIGRRILL